MTLLDTIIGLIHDEFTVSFRCDGYNNNVLTLTKSVGPDAFNLRLVEKRVALPEDHLTEAKLVDYILALSHDAEFDA